MRLRQLPAPSELSAARQIPSVSVRVVLALVGGLLTALVYGASGWLAVGIIFSLLAAWAPEYLLAWGVIVFLALGELGRSAALSWQLLVLIAGVQLLHALAMLSLALPWHSWLELAALKRPLQRFVAIQLPLQLLAVVALLLLAPGTHGQRPLTVAEFTLVGAAALALLTVLLLRLRSD